MQHADRREIVHGIVLQILVECGSDGQRAIGAEERGVAVGVGTSDPVAPILPPAPARFSTTIVCPRPSDIALATERARTSDEPPAANVTTSRIGPVGYCCASALDLDACTAQAANIMANVNVRSSRIMSLSCSGSHPIHIAVAGRDATQAS
jgi:hypothetical protein